MIYNLFRRQSKDRRRLMMEDENGFGNILGAFICCRANERRPKGQSEQRSSHRWRNSCENWTDKQFKKRFRVNQNTFNYLLQELQESIKRETTRFKVPVSPEIQLALTLYRLAHGCSFATVVHLQQLVICLGLLPQQHVKLLSYSGYSSDLF